MSEEDSNNINNINNINIDENLTTEENIKFQNDKQKKRIIFYQNSMNVLKILILTKIMINFFLIFVWMTIN